MVFSSAVQDLGADETVDYRSQDFAELYKDRPFDFIFDSVGGIVCCSHVTEVWQQPSSVQTPHMQQQTGLTHMPHGPHMQEKTL